MKKAPLFLILLVGLFTGCLNDGGGKSNRNGEANVLVRLERVGALAKSASPATIQMASLYITLTAPGADTVRDTLPLSGNAQQTISKTYGNLASLKTWTLTAVAKDGNGVVVHSGSTTFTVAPHGSENVSLVLSAQYSMLKALFFPVRDSVTRFELRVDGNLVADSAFGKQALLGDTVRLAHDYLSSSAGGVGHLIRLDAYGSMWGDSVLLYRGDTSITVVSGANTAYRVTLHWVGPMAPPTGEAEITVSLGASGTLFVDGELEDTAAVLGAATAPAWQLVGAAGFSPGLAQYPSLALDTGGNPVVAFWDGTQAGRATVRRWNGTTSWQPVGTSGFSQGEISYTSLKLDRNGNPIIAFQENANKASVMRWINNGWQYVGNAGFTQGKADHISLALNPGGYPFLAFRDGANHNKVTVMYWNGAVWQTAGIAGISQGAAEDLSLAIGTDGRPYVAFKDFSNAGRATVMRWNSSAWETVGNAGFSQGLSYHLSMKIDADGNPVVAFKDSANAWKATVMRWTGAVWQNIGPAGFTPGWADFTNLEFDLGGNPVVGFMDATKNNKASVMRWTGAAWQFVGASGLSQDQAYSLSMASNVQGNPVVAYMDLANGNRVTVMRYGYQP